MLRPSRSTTRARRTTSSSSSTTLRPSRSTRARRRARRRRPWRRLCRPSRSLPLETTEPRDRTTPPRTPRSRTSSARAQRSRTPSRSSSPRVRCRKESSPSVRADGTILRVPTREGYTGRPPSRGQKHGAGVPGEVIRVVAPAKPGRRRSVGKMK